MQLTKHNNNFTRTKCFPFRTQINVEQYAGMHLD